MRLIIEKDRDHIFIYRETEKQFKAVEPQRRNKYGQPKNPLSFDDECSIYHYTDGYFVFKIKR